MTATTAIEPRAAQRQLKTMAHWDDWQNYLRDMAKTPIGANGARSVADARSERQATIAPVEAFIALSGAPKRS